MRCVASTPSTPGISMSMSTTSGSSCSVSVSAAAPSPAAPTTSTSASDARRSEIPRRTTGWSSTTRTRIIVAPPAPPGRAARGPSDGRDRAVGPRCRSCHRNLEHERRPGPRRALHGELAPRIHREVGEEREPEVAVVVGVGTDRVEPGAVVADAEPHTPAGAGDGDVDARRRRCGRSCSARPPARRGTAAPHRRGRAPAATRRPRVVVDPAAPAPSTRGPRARRRAPRRADAWVRSRRRACAGRGRADAGRRRARRGRPASSASPRSRTTRASAARLMDEPARSCTTESWRSAAMRRRSRSDDSIARTRSSRSRSRERRSRRSSARASGSCTSQSSTQTADERRARTRRASGCRSR